MSLSDPCATTPTSIRQPLGLDATPWTAIGPLANFTAAVADCCPANGSVANFPGGPAPQACYYYCRFEGSVRDMYESMACNRGAAGERQRTVAAQGNASRPAWVGIGWHPDLEESGGTWGMGRGDGRWGVWKCVVVVLGVVGVTGGMV
ncbi:hypothetical protein SVAN01_11130 [Stagonosporopsis vannaccii]|nr:hypothetical protein SVAN01_11130 [Stagonosporopsis vannaccii]